MSDNITRTYISEKLNQQIGLSTSESAEIVDFVFEELTNHFIEHDCFKITGFGSFYKKLKKEREGRNPKTKEKAIICARHIISFVISRKLKNIINEIAK